MSPTLITAILTALQELLIAAPRLAVEIQEILAKNEPTVADWEALKAKIGERDYFSYVTDSSLPRPTNPAPDVEPPSAA